MGVRTRIDLPSLQLTPGTEPDLETADCVLTALRDGTPGALQLRNDEGGGDNDALVTELDLFILEGGTVLMDIEEPDGGSCLDRRPTSSTGALELREAGDPYWQTCLEASTSSELEVCLFRAGPDADSVHGVMPWQTQACASAEADCPAP